MRKKKKMLIIIVAVFIIAVLAPYVSKYTNKTVLKTAITRGDLKGRNYIICQVLATTPYDWQVIEKNGDKTFNEACRISIADPFSELKTSPNFSMEFNKFIFYFTERKLIYDDVLKMELVFYEVTGWDILYPVKHAFSPFNLFKSKWHIIKEYDT